LQQLAPGVWASAHSVIEAVMDADAGLHLPMTQCGRKPPQPTAFAQVEYSFSIADSHPRQQLRDHPTGWTAFTSVGHYDPIESSLILWHDRTVVEFPPGSTFLMPAGLCSVSFTAVSEPSSRMLISQSCDGELFRYVDGGLSYEPFIPNFTAVAWEADRRERAEAAIAVFPTLSEYDQQAGYA
jgi:hypothetical protein